MIPKYLSVKEFYTIKAYLWDELKNVLLFGRIHGDTIYIYWQPTTQQIPFFKFVGIGKETIFQPQKICS